MAEQMQPMRPRYFKDFYTYEIDFLGLVAAEQRNGQIQIQADSDFLWERAVMFADIAGAAQTIDSQVVPLVTVLVTNVGSGRQLMQVQIPVFSVFGTGQLPFVLPEPSVFKARSSINVAVTNFSAATEYNLRLSFIGTKIFPMG